LFFGAQYSCAILEAFARRGMGVGASQGSASIRGDETISFDNGKPVVTTHPASVNICAGANHTFNVVATGVDLSYQWQLSTDGGANFNNIAGATSANYALTGITVSMNNYRYRCIVSGCPPAAISNVATLTVADPPSVTSSPSDVTVCEGANTSFTVGVSGAGTLYQWQVSTNGGNSYSNITAATTATLTLNNVTPAMNNNWYRCALTNAVCTTPVHSAAAKLTVNANTVITQQPVGTTLCLGAAHTLCVTVAGTNLQYQWEAAPGCGGPWTNVTAANSSCLTVTPTGTFSYRCRISGTCGAAVVTDCITITVINPITISQQPVDREICSGSNTSFSVTASSNETINYQWQLSTDGGNNWSNVVNTATYSGATTATLNITGTTTGMTGTRYRNQLNTAACASPVISGTAALTVRQLPTVVLSASPYTSLLPGQITTLTATPSGSTGGTFTTLWFLNNTPVPNSGNTRQVNVEQVGNYRVNVQETFLSGLTCSNQSDVVVIDAKASSKLFIFPSPNNGRFTVSYYNSNGNSTQRRIIIYDSKGAQVYDRQFPITGPYTLIPIDLRAAQRGIYFVRVGDVSGNVLAEGKVHVH
jgi:Secretion system C-terminal sorting domain